MYGNFSTGFPKSSGHPNLCKRRPCNMGLMKSQKQDWHILKQHAGNQVSETGLWVNEAFPYLAASPDGIFTDSDGNVGLIEIKCLKILREQSVNDLLQLHKDGQLPGSKLSQQCFTITDTSLKLRESHCYYYQVQLQLLVNDIDFCDFVSPLYSKDHT